jgi:hypothetical protein
MGVSPGFDGRDIARLAICLSNKKLPNWQLFFRVAAELHFTPANALTTRAVLLGVVWAQEAENEGKPHKQPKCRNTRPYDRQ